MRTIITCLYKLIGPDLQPQHRHAHAGHAPQEGPRPRVPQCHSTTDPSRPPRTAPARIRRAHASGPASRKRQCAPATLRSTTAPCRTRSRDVEREHPESYLRVVGAVEVSAHACAAAPSSWVFAPHMCRDGQRLMHQYTYGAIREWRTYRRCSKQGLQVDVWRAESRRASCLAAAPGQAAAIPSVAAAGDAAPAPLWRAAAPFLPGNLLTTCDGCTCFDCKNRYSGPLRLKGARNGHSNGTLITL